jgi:hypothetical protein
MVGHEPRRFEEFRRRYIEELRSKRPRLTALRAGLRQGTLTLGLLRQDTEHNDAVVLAEVLRRAGRRVKAESAARRATRSKALGPDRHTRRRLTPCSPRLRPLRAPRVEPATHSVVASRGPNRYSDPLARGRRGRTMFVYPLAVEAEDPTVRPGCSQVRLSGTGRYFHRRPSA